MAGETANIGKLIVDLLLRDEQFTGALDAAEGKTSSVFPRMDKAAKKAMTSISRGFKVAAASITALAAATTVVGSQFEQQMSTVASIRKISDKTSDAYVRMEERARQLGATTAFSATEAAKGMEELARAGLDVEEILVASELSLKMAGAANISLGLSAKMVAASMAQFGLEASQAGHITDVLTTATQNSLFSMTDLGEAMKFAGPVGAVFGKDIIEVTAAVSQFRDMGMEGTMAGTQFRMMMAMASKPTKKAEEALAKYGLTINDINPEVKSFKEIMVAVGEAGVTAGDSFKIFGRRAGGAVAAIAKKMRKSTKRFDDLVVAMENSAGTTDKTYDIMMDNVIGQTTILRSVIAETMIAVFNTYKGPLTELLKALQDFVRALGSEIFLMSGEMSGKFEDVLGEITRLIKENTRAGAKGAAEFIRLLQDVMVQLTVLLPALTAVAMALASMIPYLDEIAVLFATIWVTAKILSYHAVMVKLLPATVNVTAATYAFGAALTMSTGGLVVVLAAAAALAAGLAYLARQWLFAAAAARKYEEDTQASIRNHETAKHSITRSIGRELQARKELIAWQRSSVTEMARKSEADKLQMSIIEDMTDAEAARAFQLGQLIMVNGNLLTTEEAIADEINGRPAILRKIEMHESKIAELRQKRSREHGEMAQLRTQQIEEHQTSLRTLKKAVRALSEEESEADRIRRQGLEDLAEARRTEEKRTRAEADEAAALEKKREEEKKAIAKWQIESAQALSKVLWRQEEINYETTRFWAEQGEQAREADRIQRIQDLWDERDEQAKIAAEIHAAWVEEHPKAAKARERAQALLLRLQRLGEAVVPDGVRKRVASFVAKSVQAFKKLGKTVAGKGVDAFARFGGAIAHALKLDRPNKFNKAMGELGRRAGRVLKEVAGIVGMLVQGFVEAIPAVGKFGKSIVSAMGKAKSAFTGLLSKFGFDFDIMGAIADLASPDDSEEDKANRRPMFTADAAKELVDTAVEAALAFVQAIIDALPHILGRLATAIPILIKAIADALPSIAQTLAEKIPEILFAVLKNIGPLLNALIDAGITIVEGVLEELPDMLMLLLGTVLPQLIKKLGDAIPKLISAITAAIPLVLTAITDSLPSIIDALIEAFPKIVMAVVNAIPVILTAVIQAIGPIVEAVIEALPDIIDMLADLMPQVILALIAALPPLLWELIKMVGVLIVTVLENVDDIVIAIAEGIVDALKTMLGAVGELFKKKKNKKKNQASAYSGIDYVPATMRMTVHQGEAVIPADRNASAMAGGPAAAGAAAAGQLRNGAANMPQSVEVVVMAEGRMLDAVQVDAMRLGHASGMKKAIRRASGAKVGLNRGRFNAWSS